MLTLLSATPASIAQMTKSLSEERLLRRPDVDAWSAQEIVAHLRACAEVWGRSIDRMVAEDHPTIRYVSPRGWIKKTTICSRLSGKRCGRFRRSERRSSRRSEH